jgi:hypothetical protein
MTEDSPTLATLLAEQNQLEALAEKLLRDAKAVKVSLKSNPLNADLPELLRELRRDADACKTFAARLNSALVDHADAEHAKEMAQRPRWRPNRHSSPGERVRRDMAKRGCLAGDIDAPGFGV